MACDTVDPVLPKNVVFILSHALLNAILYSLLNYLDYFYENIFLQSSKNNICFRKPIIRGYVKPQSYFFLESNVPNTWN